jgi:hypothetical protein
MSASATQVVSGTPLAQPSADAASVAAPAAAPAGGGSKKHKVPGIGQAPTEAMKVVQGAYNAAAAHLAPARLPEELRQMLRVGTQSIHFLATSEWWCVFANEDYEDQHALLVGDRFFVKWAIERADEAYIVFSSGRSPTVIMRNVRSTARPRASHIKIVTLGNADREGSFYGYRLSFPKTMLAKVYELIGDRWHTMSRTNNRDTIMQMDIGAKEDDPVLPQLMAQGVACINTRYIFRSDARSRQMTVRVHKKSSQDPTVNKEQLLFGLIPDVQTRGAQCLLRAGMLRVTAADDQDVLTIGEELKGKGFSVFYDAKPVPMGNVYNGPVSSHELPAAMQPENKIQCYHLRSMRQLAPETFDQVAKAMGAKMCMWHRNYAVIHFQDPSRKPGSFPFAVPDADHGVKGLTVVLPTDF